MRQGVLRPAHTWQRRRYTYEAEVDVLRYRGAEPFDEAKLGELAEEMPYQHIALQPLAMASCL
jgi:hypothetical protein